jgi:hypothetical protein
MIFSWLPDTGAFETRLRPNRASTATSSTRLSTLCATTRESNTGELGSSGGG